MNPDLRLALRDAEGRLVKALSIVRRALHGSEHELRQLRDSLLGCGAGNPFLFFDVERVLADAIHEQSTTNISN